MMYNCIIVNTHILLIRHGEAHKAHWFRAPFSSICKLWNPMLWVICCLLYLRAVMHTWQFSHIIMSAMSSQVTGVSIVYSNVCSGADQRQHSSSASLTFVRVVHRYPVKSPHKRPLTRKCFHLMTSLCGCPLLCMTKGYFELNYWIELIYALPEIKYHYMT